MKNMKTELCEIMTKYGSDKGSNHHNYTIYYYELFKNIKNEKLTIFELGLGTNNLDVKSNMGKNGIPGASLRGWKEFFPNSTIYGADIDKRILFNEDRITTFFCDQNEKNIILDMWKNDDLKDLYFDIIIDDGLHEFNANLTFLVNSIHKLKENGIYICEDLLPHTIESFQKEMENLKEKYPYHFFEIIKLPLPTNKSGDNNLLVIKKNNFS